VTPVGAVVVVVDEVVVVVTGSVVEVVVGALVEVVVVVVGVVDEVVLVEMVVVGPSVVVVVLGEVAVVVDATDVVVVVDATVVVVVLLVEEEVVVVLDEVVVVVVGGASAHCSTTFRPVTRRSAQNAPLKPLPSPSLKRASGADRNASTTTWAPNFAWDPPTRRMGVGPVAPGPSALPFESRRSPTTSSVLDPGPSSSTVTFRPARREQKLYVPAASVSVLPSIRTTSSYEPGMSGPTVSPRRARTDGPPQ